MSSSSSNILDLIDDLISDDSDAAGISFITQYRSVSETVTPPAGTLAMKDAGDGTKKPESFFRLPDGRYAVSLDSWGSQANRFESALLRHKDDLGLPLITFVRTVDDREESAGNSLTWSHRQSDVTFRVGRLAAAKAGVPFDDIQQATPSCADALLGWFPQSLIFGWWNSHSKVNEEKWRQLHVKAGLPANEKELTSPTGANSDAHRSARAVSSEIIAKGVALRTRHAARVDNVFGPVKSKKDAKDKGDGKGPLAQLGFGSIPPASAPKDVSYDSIEGRTFVSLTRLRQFGFSDPNNTVTYRKVLVLLALAGIVAAQRETLLRSGTDLIVQEGGVTVSVERHGAASEAVTLPKFEEVAAALRAAVAAAGLEWHTRQVTVDVTDIKLIETVLNSQFADTETESTSEAETRA